jgi:hypothetical protein
VDHFRLTTDALSSPTLFDSHPSLSTRFWHSPRLSDRLLGSSGQVWSMLAGRYSLLSPCSPIHLQDRISSVLAIQMACRAAAETHLPTRTIIIVPPTKQVRKLLKSQLSPHPFTMVEVPANTLPSDQPEFDHPYPLPPPNIRNVANHKQFCQPFMVILVQNIAANSRNPCNIHHLRYNIPRLLPLPCMPALRPRTAFTCPQYAQHPSLPTQLLQWADPRDTPSLPKLAPKGADAPPYLSIMGHPRLLGAMGLPPARLGRMLEINGLAHSASSIRSISNNLLQHTVSKIQKWLVRKHSHVD